MALETLLFDDDEPRPDGGGGACYWQAGGGKANCGMKLYADCLEFAIIIWLGFFNEPS